MLRDLYYFISRLRIFPCVLLSALLQHHVSTCLRTPDTPTSEHNSRYFDVFLICNYKITNFYFYFYCAHSGSCWNWLWCYKDDKDEKAGKKVRYVAQRFMRSTISVGQIYSYDFESILQNKRRKTCERYLDHVNLINLILISFLIDVLRQTKALVAINYKSFKKNTIFIFWGVS